ncbi:MAG TPA: GNAT family N-acetyltransferase [Galbitalea sp.]|jgi:GNAT superfamily N-acetyltransferase
MDIRVATAADIEAVTETIRLAFLDDPVWGPALALPGGSTSHLDPFWRIYVRGGLRFDGVYLTGNADTIAVWTPPGESELSPEQEDEIVELVHSALPKERAAAMVELFDRFDAAHPHDRPHAYLGLLATHPTHRGRGIGQQLLAANLAELDARGLPAYLESTNPANLHRYERAGFAQHGSFRAVLDDALVTTMWREPRGDRG